jgi:hypothetical protein
LHPAPEKWAGKKGFRVDQKLFKKEGDETLFFRYRSARMLSSHGPN